LSGLPRRRVRPEIQTALAIPRAPVHSNLHRRKTLEARRSMGTQDKRTTSRHNIDRGLAMLSYPGLPVLACTILDLSEGGIGCLAPLNAFDAATQAKWRQTLSAGQVLNSEISAPPHLIHFELKVEVRHARPSGRIALELGLRFPELDSTQQSKLAKALIEWARQHGPAMVPPKPPTGFGKEGSPPPSYDPYRGYKLGQVLVKMGLLTKEAVEEAETEAALIGEKLGRFLLYTNRIEAEQLCRALSLQSGLPMTDLKKVAPNQELRELFSYLTLKRYEFIPMDASPYLLCIAAASPLAPEDQAKLEELANRPIQVFLVPEDGLQERLFQWMPSKSEKERQFERVALSFPAFLQFCNAKGFSLDGKVLDGYTLDLSEGGLKIHAPPPESGTPDELLHRGSCARILLDLPKQKIQLLARLRNCAPAEVKGRGPTFEYGFQIIRMSTQERDKLRALLNELTGP
jgi:hypothetical protein